LPIYSNEAAAVYQSIVNEMKPAEPVQRPAVILAPGAGRAYPMGRINALFKADGEETGNRYSISEWWLDPHIRNDYAAFFVCAEAGRMAWISPGTLPLAAVSSSSQIKRG
jgi:hypothetical protein